jgi:cytidylate kinase
MDESLDMYTFYDMDERERSEKYSYKKLHVINTSPCSQLTLKVNKLHPVPEQSKKSKERGKEKMMMNQYQAIQPKMNLTPGQILYALELISCVNA